MYHTTFGSHKRFYLFFFIRTGSTNMKASENEKNRSSTLGPLHLNPMDILRNVLPQEFKVSSNKCMDFILFFNPLIYCQN